MADPQTENGFTPLANELIEAFSKVPLAGSESQLLFAVLRKTYGFHKKVDSISLSQLVEATGVSRRMVIYSLQNLEAKRMLNIKRVRGRGNVNQINDNSIQKNYELWVVQRKSNQ